MNFISKKSFVTGYIENNHPAFLLIPFKAEDVFHNSEINRNHKADLKKLMQLRYPEKYITITTSGRKALSLALNHRRVNTTPNDVYIQTTSDNLYISSCVTQIIEQKDRWFRESKSKQDIVLANHEFGYTDNRISNCQEAERLIEDCAFSFDSKFNNGCRVGSVASYSIFSFSKFFPIQFGGCLVSDKPIQSNEDSDMLNYVENVVGFYFDRVNEWSDIRLKIRSYYTEVFNCFGCKTVFANSQLDIPGVFLFYLPRGVDKQRLKEYYWRRGVQCSAFYGKDALFLPLNQYTTRLHVDFFADILKSFLSGTDE